MQSIKKVSLSDRWYLKGLTGTLHLELESLQHIAVFSGHTRLQGDEMSLRYAADSIRKQVLAGKFIDINSVRGAIDKLRIVLKHIYTAGLPCIPGSTVKGTIRSRLELMAGGRGKLPEASACISVEEHIPRTPPTPGKPGWRHITIWGSAVTVERERESYIEEEYVAELCPVCNIFGGPGIASRVMFSDFCGCKTVVKDTVYGMPMEFLPPNCVLKGFVILRGLSLAELGLLLIGMGFNGSSFKPILIGRFKYAGKNIGKAVFRAVKLELRRVYLDMLRGDEKERLGLKNIALKAVGDLYIAEGATLNQILERAFNAARREYPDIELFSEAEEKELRARNLALVDIIK